MGLLQDYSGCAAVVPDGGSVMPGIRQLLEEATAEMETLEHFADQEKWDGLILRLREATKQF